MSQGILRTVTRDTFSTSLTADAAAGATVLHVARAGDFSVVPGRLRVGMPGASVDYRYTAVDKAAATITLATALTAGVNVDDPVVLLTSAGVPAERWVAQLDVGTDEPLPVTIPQNTWTDRFVEGDDQAGMIVTYDVVRGEYVVVGTGDQAVPITGEALNDVDGSGLVGLPGGSDGQPPTSTPPPLLVPGFGYLDVVQPAVTNADPVTVDLWASTMSPVDHSGPPLLAIQMPPNAPGKLQLRQIGGTPLDSSTTYYVVTRARDTDGHAGFSTEVSGSPAQAGSGDVVITADMLLAANAIVEALSAADLSAVNMTAVNLEAATGTFSSVTFLGALLMRGVDNLLQGTLTMGSTVTAPRARPRLSGAWASLETNLDVTEKVGLCDDGAEWLTTGEVYGYPTLSHLSKTTGIASSSSQTFADGSTAHEGPGGGRGVVKIGTRYYLLAPAENVDDDRHVVRALNGAYDEVDRWTWPDPGTSMRAPVITTDGTRLLIVWVSYSAGATSPMLNWQAYTTAGALFGSQVSVALPKLVGLTGAVYLANGGTMFPDARMCCTTTDPDLPVVVTDLTSYRPANAWPLPDSVATARGLDAAGGVFHTLAPIGRRGYVFDHTTLSGQIDIGSTNRDTDPAGAGITETDLVNRTTRTMIRFAQQVIRVDDPQWDGTVDGANGVGIYAGAVADALYLQQQVTAKPWQTTISSLATGTDQPPAGNGFLNRPGVAGRTRSAAVDNAGNPLTDLTGTGTARAAKLIQSGTATVNVTTAGTPATVNVTFPVPFDTVPDVQVSTNVMQPQNFAVSRFNVTTTGFTAVGWRSTAGAVLVGWTASTGT